MPVVLRPEVEASESLDSNETVVTEPIIVVKPAETITVTKTVGGNVMAEAIAIILVLLLVYGLFRLVLFVIPYMIGLGLVAGLGYFGYLLL